MLSKTIDDKGQEVLNIKAQSGECVQDSETISGDCTQEYMSGLIDGLPEHLLLTVTDGYFEPFNIYARNVCHFPNTEESEVCIYNEITIDGDFLRTSCTPPSPSTTPSPTTTPETASCHISFDYSDESLFCDQSISDCTYFPATIASCADIREQMDLYEILLSMGLYTNNANGLLSYERLNVACDSSRYFCNGARCNYEEDDITYGVNWMESGLMTKDGKCTTTDYCGEGEWGTCTPISLDQIDIDGVTYTETEQNGICQYVVIADNRYGPSDDAELDPEAAEHGKCTNVDFDYNVEDPCNYYGNAMNDLLDDKLKGQIYDAAFEFCTIHLPEKILEPRGINDVRCGWRQEADLSYICFKEA